MFFQILMSTTRNWHVTRVMNLVLKKREHLVWSHQNINNIVPRTTRQSSQRSIALHVLHILCDVASDHAAAGRSGKVCENGREKTHNAQKCMQNTQQFRWIWNRICVDLPGSSFRFCSGIILIRVRESPRGNQYVEWDFCRNTLVSPRNQSETMSRCYHYRSLNSLPLSGDPRD